MNINKDNSNNKGGGKVDKKVIAASRVLKSRIAPGENFGITTVVEGENLELSQSQKRVGGKVVIIPKTFHNNHQIKIEKSTYYPQVIHKPCGERVLR